MPGKEKAISVRLDGEALRALAWLTRNGRTQSGAVRDALLQAARVSEREQMEADAKRIANDPRDRAVIAEIREFFGEPDWPR